MCGIIGMYVINEAKINYKLKTIYKNQSSRGRSGSGCAVMRNGKLLRYRNDDADRFFIDIEQVKKAKAKKGDFYCFHHRLPTSTENIAVANHPIRNEKKNIYLIHNGVVSNAEKLHKELEARGHKFETAIERESGLFEGAKKEKYVIRNFTDTEVLVHLIEEKWNECQDIKETMKYVCEKATGSYALAFMIKGEDKIFLFKHNNPIVLFKDKTKNVFFASEFPKDNKNFTLIKDMGYNEIGFLDCKGYHEIGMVESPLSKWDNWSYEGKYYSKSKGKSNDGSNKISNGKKQFAIEEAMYFHLKGMDLEEAIYTSEWNYGLDFSKKMKKRVKRYVDKLSSEDRRKKFIDEFEKINFGYNLVDEFNTECSEDDLLEQCYCYYCGETLKESDIGCMDSCDMPICRKCEIETIEGMMR